MPLAPSGSGCGSDARLWPKLWLFSTLARSSFTTALRMSEESTIAYRRKVWAVDQPATFIIVDSATPASRSNLAALRLKSWGVLPVYLNASLPHLHLFPSPTFWHLRQVSFPSDTLAHSFCQLSLKSLTGLLPFRASK